MYTDIKFKKPVETDICVVKELFGSISCHRGKYYDRIRILLIYSRILTISVFEGLFLKLIQFL